MSSKPFSSTSTFSFTGDATDTLNTLTQAINPDTSKTLADLDYNNYPNGTSDGSSPNSINQTIFNNQPMSWWISELQSGTVKYFPHSNYVNWAYIDASNNVYHIDISISNALIPNYTKNISADPETKITTITFVDKFGLSRVDTIIM